MLKPILVMTAIASVMVFYQNCSPMRTTETTLASEVDFEKWVAGEKAWNAKCLSCHGGIDSSPKRGAGISRITDALSTQSEMMNLQVTQEEIANIAYALTNERPSTPGNGQERPSQKFLCENEALRGASAKAFRRLSSQEVENVLVDLFGQTIVDGAATEIGFLPSEVSLKSKDFVPVLSAEYFDAMIKIAEKISDDALANDTFFTRYGACTDQNSEACVRNVISGFAERALRRPLNGDVLDSFMASFNANADVDAAGLVMAVMMRPDFGLQVEKGTPDGDRNRLDSYEVAARISFGAVGSLPDDTLWALAKSDGLKDLAVVKAQVQRLIDSPRGKQKVVRFFREWMGVKGQVDVASTAAHTNGLDAPKMHEAALTDFDRFVESIIWEKNGVFRDLFTDGSVYPENADLAGVYGSGVWQTGAAPLASSNGHKGIFLRPASLMGGSNHTPIILRGVRVRTDILCDPLGIPTIDIITARDEDQDPESIDHAFFANRDVVKSLTKSDSCMGCHSQINPLGFAMEAFDSFGRLQSVEKVYDMDDNQIAEYPVDATAEDMLIETGALDAVQGPEELNAQLAESRKVRACFAEKLTEFVNRRVASEEDHCALADKEVLARDDGSTVKDVLIKNIANDDIFWRGR